MSEQAPRKDPEDTPNDWERYVDESRRVLQIDAKANRYDYDQMIFDLANPPPRHSSEITLNSYEQLRSVMSQPPPQDFIEDPPENYERIMFGKILSGNVVPEFDKTAAEPIKLPENLAAMALLNKDTRPGELFQEETKELEMEAVLAGVASFPEIKSEPETNESDPDNTLTGFMKLPENQAAVAALDEETGLGEFFQEKVEEQETKAVIASFPSLSEVNTEPGTNEGDPDKTLTEVIDLHKNQGTMAAFDEFTRLSQAFLKNLKDDEIENSIANFPKVRAELERKWSDYSSMCRPLQAGRGHGLSERTDREVRAMVEYMTGTVNDAPCTRCVNLFNKASLSRINKGPVFPTCVTSTVLCPFVKHCASCRYVAYTRCTFACESHSLTPSERFGKLGTYPAYSKSVMARKPCESSGSYG
jgi:hypothetical protein